MLNPALQGREKELKVAVKVDLCFSFKLKATKVKPFKTVNLKTSLTGIVTKNEMNIISDCINATAFWCDATVVD